MAARAEPAQGLFGWVWSQVSRWRRARRLNALLRVRGSRTKATRPGGSGLRVKSGAKRETRAAWKASEIDRLRVNASNYLFEGYGVHAIPGAYWALLERHHRPIEAFKAFLAHLGLDTEAIRRRDADEVAKLRDYCEFLFLFDDDSSLINEAERGRIAKMIAAEGHKGLGAVLERLARARLVASIADEQPPTPCVAFATFQRKARAATSDPSKVSAQQLSDLQTAAMTWREALSQAAAALQEARAAEAGLDALLRDGAALAPEQLVRREHAAKDIAAAARRIEAEATINPAAIREAAQAIRIATTQFDALRERILAQRAEEARAKREQARREQEQRQREEQERAHQRQRQEGQQRAEQEAQRWRRSYGDVEEALAFLGFGAEDAPRWSEIQRRFVKMRAEAEKAFSASGDRSANDRMRDLQAYFLEALRPNKARFA